MNFEPHDKSGHSSNLSINIKQAAGCIHVQQFKHIKQVESF